MVFRGKCKGRMYLSARFDVYCGTLIGFQVHFWQSPATSSITRYVIHHALRSAAPGRRSSTGARSSAGFPRLQFHSEPQK